MEKQKIPKYWLLILFMMISTFGLAQQTITVRPLPAFNAGPNLYMGSGQTYVIPTVTGSPTDSYYWQGPNGFTSTLMQPQLSSLGTYTCTATNAYGCFTTDDVDVLASLWLQNPLPSLCIGDTLLLDLYIPDPGTGTFTGTGVANRMFVATSSGNFDITYTSGTETAIATANVYAGPNVYVSRDTAFNCFGNNVSLQAIGYANTFAWSYLSDPGTSLATTANYSVVVDTLTRYLLTAGMTYTNKTCYIRDTVVVVPIEASFTYVQDTGQGPYGQMFGSNVKFAPDYKAAYSYSWNFGNNYVPGGGTSTEISPTYNYNPYYGYFTVTLRMNSFCGVSTVSKVVRVNYLITGIDTPMKESEIQLYPNPAVDFIYLQFGENRVVRIQIFDLTGKLVSNIQLNDSSYRLDVSSYRSGSYILKAVDERGSSVTAKFIKQ